MVHLSIPISEDLQDKLKVRAEQSGHASVESYVSELVREDVEAVDYGAPPGIHVRSQDELSAAIAEGLRSPAREMTGTDWDKLRADLIAKDARSKAG
jgi:hypothetical protein